MRHDTLSEVLRSIRLRGAVFFHMQGEAPWVIEAPPAGDIASTVMPGAEHVMAYHVVTRGACWAAVVGSPPVRVEQGDIIVFARGDAHVLSSVPGMRASYTINPLLFPPQQRPPFSVVVQGESVSSADYDQEVWPERTMLVCGFLGCDARPFNPLIGSLPRLLIVRAKDDASDGWLAQFIRFAVSESSQKRPGGKAVLERMSELMFVDLLREYIDGLAGEQAGWLGGLRDRIVGRALALMHERPAENWTIDSLADMVGLSRSALHERFVHFTGQPPMQYLASWRMQLAAGLLRESGAGLAAIALEVGYESAAAFSRAFKRATGVPPAQWRRDNALDNKAATPRPP